LPKERAGTRNVYIYPEKQTAVERLSARIVAAICPYLDETVDDDRFESLSLEVKAVGRKFIREFKDENLKIDSKIKKEQP
jgi:hypothetical protein